MASLPSTPLHDGWATSGTAELDEPAAQRLANGWVPGLPPPAGQVNWLYQRFTEWLHYLSEAKPFYATLEAAYDGTTEGDLCTVWENDRADYPGVELASGAADGADLIDVCCTGNQVIYVVSGVNNPKLVARAAISVVIRTFTRTNAGTAVRLATDGRKVVLAYGNYVECWAIVTGTSEWVYNHGAAVADVCIYDNMVFLVGASGTGTKDARGLSLSAGTATWSYNHNATLTGVAAANGRVFISGGASGHASGANLRAIAAATGDDATAEGSASADTNLAWNVVLANVTTARCVAVDHTTLYLGFASGATNQVEAMSQADATVRLGVRPLTGMSVLRLAVDQGYVYAACQDATPDGYLYALGKDFLATFVRREVLLRPFTCVATDGMGLFVGRGGVAGGEAPLRRYVRGNRACTFRRFDGATAHAAFPNPRSLVPEK